ncbi:hypothetical protein [Cognatilysobacter lacus]|uniref:Lipoprotein n=1 Tax=Cognatilysobacter lacus TaxID=1643323 RepID=A0A5D8YJ53_9GAMM|nr:hypothetical protein [Lysobacter lacus]TZF82848.1 hypothetical protein FW784_13270 [Lysobacter lacus]
MTADRPSAPARRSTLRLSWVLAAVAMIAGCAPVPTRPTTPPGPVVAPPTGPSDFTIPAGELETWNAVGQLLVRLPGVTYEGRSQKLGLYAVDYQGEQFLVLTRALLASDEVRTLTTRVRVALQDGTPDRSAASTELLAVLQARLPDELIRIAALPKPAPAKTKVVARKRAVKRAARR